HTNNNINLFFSDETDTMAFYIYYPDIVKDTINAPNPSNDVQKRYKALLYQQKILDNIFDYYSNNQENFYRVADSKNISTGEINDLYKKLSNLNNTLDDFTKQYNTFIDAVDNGISDIMEYNITSYSFQLNKVIDASFSFIYKFHNIYSKYCLTNYDSYTQENLNVYVDKAYLDIAYIVYLENFKSFNFSVGENGVCDLSGVVGSDSDYNLLKFLDSKKSLNPSLLNNLTEGSTDYESTLEKLNEFSYSRDVFDQKLNSYLLTYNSLNMYTISSYRFDQVSGVEYDNYIKSLSASDRATVTMLENFIEHIFKNYISKLNNIVS
ncbi:MAG: hypothetical protein ACI4PF_06210, partial [Christensenellales bacterium]